MQLTTLGGLRLESTDFTRPKPLLLLCYLAIEGPQQRRVLADVFFPDAKDPRDSLSTALRHLKDVGDEVAIADGRRVRCGVPCDATRLIETLDAGILEPALDLYDGPFLAGLDLELAEELEEWVFTTREYLASRVREAHVRLAEDLAAKGEGTLAGRRAEQAMSLDGGPPLTPDDYPRIYRLLTLGGSPRAAELRAEAEEFGIEVGELLEGNAGRAFLQRSPHDIAPNNLPPESTSFVGRDTERMEIAGLLSAPHGRVLTIHGPGGMGKSRLALRAARDRLVERTFEDGVFFLPFEDIDSVHRIPETVAAALGVALTGTGGPLSQLAREIGAQRILLILDGFERVADGASAVSHLVSECPNLKFLVTSRARLGLIEEHVLPLEGLPSPEAGARYEDALDSDALQLFVQRAKKTRLDFRLAPEDVPHAVRICGALHGSPLGIELAVPWIRAMPIPEIRKAVESDLGFLESDVRNVHEGHESLRRVFTRSWDMLGVREQDVLRKLAIFRGGFRREAAARVAGATLPTLLGLADASLVKMMPSGRFRVHALIHQFCMERLQSAPDVLEYTTHLHQDYFRGFTREVLENVYSSKEREALFAIDEELENILHAWRGILASDRDPAKDVPTKLIVFFDRRRHYREGIRFFGEALRHLGAERQGDPDLVAEVRANLAWLHVQTGDMREAETFAREALVGSGETSAGRMMAHNIVGIARRYEFDLTEAAQHFESAIAIAEARGEANRAAMYLLNLSNVKSDMGDYSGASAYLARTIRFAEEIAYPYLLVLSWNNLATIKEEQGDIDAARRLYTDALELARESGYAKMEPRILTNLAEISLESGEPTTARQLLDEAERASGEAPDGALEALTLDILGRIHLNTGDLSKAEESLQRSLELAMSFPQAQRHLKVLAHLADLWVSESRWAEAVRLLRTLRSQPVLPRSVRGRVNELLQAIPEPLQAHPDTESHEPWPAWFVRLEVEARLSR